MLTMVLRLYNPIQIAVRALTKHKTWGNTGNIICKVKRGIKQYSNIIMQYGLFFSLTFVYERCDCAITARGRWDKS